MRNEKKFVQWVTRHSGQYISKRVITVRNAVIPILC